MVCFLAVAVLAALLLISSARYLEVSSDIVKLNRTMDNLESEYATMSAEYERLFDLSSIEEAVGAEMNLPTGDQVVYIDLSEPDTVTIFGLGGEDNPITSFLDGLGEALHGFVSYFR